MTPLAGFRDYPEGVGCRGRRAPLREELKRKEMTMMNTTIKLDSKSSGAAALVKELVQPVEGFTTGKITVTFDFTCDKGADETYTAVQELCPWTLVAVLMNKINGNTQNCVKDMVQGVMDMSDAQRKVLRDSLKASTTKVLEDMGAMVQKVRAGKTRITVDGEANLS